MWLLQIPCVLGSLICWHTTSTCAHITNLLAGNLEFTKSLIVAYYSAAFAAQKIVQQLLPNLGIMGKRGFRDEEQEAADLERRASEKRAKTAYNKVVAILKLHPEASEKAFTHLMSLGFSAEQEISKAPLSRAASSVIERQEARKTHELQAHSTLPKEFASSDPADLVPTKADTFEGLIAPLLTKHCLSAMEPGTLSTSNLRSMTLKFKEAGIDSAKNEYLRLLEFSSGTDKLARIAGRLRVWKLLEEELRLQAQWRGRRCKDVTLPISWPKDGVYKPVLMDNGKLAIKQNATGRAELVPESKMPDTVIKEDLHIKYNRSEVRAALYFTPGTDGTPFKIVELFPDVSEHILDEYRAEYALRLKQQQQHVNALEDISSGAKSPSSKGASANVASSPKQTVCR